MGKAGGMGDWALHEGDALDILPTLAAGTVDLVLADPPYGTTACKWDSVIPLDAMWRELRRVAKPNAAIVLFAAQPFTSALVMSNPTWFKYQWVWKKTRPFDFFNCRNKPLRLHEDICVFSKGTVANRSPRRMSYNPQGLVRVDRPWKRPRTYGSAHNYDRPSNKLDRVIEFTGYPTTVLEFANSNEGSLHPAQKPVDLLSYLIRTYSNPGDVVLDFCAGSFSTGVACVQEGRNFIGIEKDAAYFEVGKRRMAGAQPGLPLGAA